MGIMILTYAKLKTNSEVIFAVKDDWDYNYPLLDIRIYDASPNMTLEEYYQNHTKPLHESPYCPEGYEIVVYEVWKGTEYGCNCLGVHDPSVRLKDKVFKGSCTYNESLEGCTYVASTPPTVMTIFDDKFICGKRLPLEFYNIPRPDFYTGECEEGFRRCGGEHPDS